MTAPSQRVGVDVGGTFTDVVAIHDGRIHVTKTSSTPESPAEGVLDGLETSREGTDTDHGDIGFLAHGTTQATNAVLEREWADTALITTDGFRDVIEIGRQARPDIYDVRATKPEPIVARDRRYEVTERLDERGEVQVPVDEESVDRVVREIAGSDVESAAVSLLFSFENDDHERRVGNRLDEDADVSYSLSSTVLPEIREYERTLATALNAALKPVMDDYLATLERRIERRGVPAALRIMQSNGGIIDADLARETPINTLLSGPAAGVQGAAHVADLRGMDDVVTMDMGGTSCDVSLVRGGDPVVSTEVEVGGYPVGVPMIDIHTIGSGGGSIAWLDAGDALRVGPRSAGARPGPIAYGRGGEEPTVTDAHVLLGRLDPGTFLADGFDANGDLVYDRVAATIADPLDLSVEEAAQGVLDVANANMERALRVVSVERGHDPREFGLVAFGGAGPLHASALAESLDVSRVIVPRTAGVLSALGLLVTDLVHDFSTSRVRPLADVAPTDLEETFEEFEDEGRTRLRAEGRDADEMVFERYVDLRYAGQSFELRVPVPGAHSDADERGLTDDDLTAIGKAFHDRHERRYGHASPDEPIELVTIRLRARGLVESPELEVAEREGSADDAVRETRGVIYDGDERDTPIYDRDTLPPGGGFEGPAVVEGGASTVVIRPGQEASVDEYGNIVVEVDP